MNSQDDSQFTLKSALGYTVADYLRDLARITQDSTEEDGSLRLSPAAVHILTKRLTGAADYIDALRAELAAADTLIAEGEALLKKLLEGELK